MFSFSGIYSLYLFSYDRENIYNLKKTLHLKLEQLKFQKLRIVLQTDPGLFFAKRFGAGFMVQSRFEAEIFLQGYFMERSQRFFNAIFSSFFDQQNLVENSFINPCKVLTTISLKNITRAATVFAITYRTF